MHDWRFNYNCACDDDTRTSSRRIFSISSCKVYNNIGESKTIWTVGEKWRVPIGEPFQTCFGICYDHEDCRVDMVTFGSLEEAQLFIKALIAVINTRGENELCAMLSGYVWGKLIQAEPEKIKRMHEEEKAYEQALAEKRAQEKKLAKLNKRNSKSQPAHVYIFSFDERFCKIGIANNVEERRRTKISETGRAILQWGYSELFPRGKAEEIESLCHTHFKDFRTYGEFFSVTFDEACVYLQSQITNPLTICREERK